MRHVAILYSEYTPAIDAIKYQLQDCEIDCFTELKNTDKYDLIINIGCQYEGNALACHHSLLPAFDCEEPEREAVLAGVKVTGITIYFTESQKIIAQYPVFIKNDTHYDELKQELDYIEQTILPLVVQKILNNESFEVRSLLNKACSGKCGGCSTCNH